MTRDMKEVCKRFESVTGMRVVVQERAGDSVKSTAKAEPPRNQSCGRTDCFPCTTGGGGKCEKNSSGNIIIFFLFFCQMDGKSTEYEGETARNAFTRWVEGRNCLRLKDEANPLLKHCLLAHRIIKAEFKMLLVGVHRTPLVRPLNKAVRIIISRAEFIMNSKSEWHQAPLVHVIPMCGLQED